MDKVGEVNWKRFERFLFAIGCEFKSQESSHRKYKLEGISRPIIIPCRDELPQFVILNNLRTLGISKKEYLSIIVNL